ncbi:unnamed protein product, partial [Cladocopium goreaui]
MEKPGTPGTAEVQLVAPSGLLQTLQLRIDALAAETIRTSLKEMGKEAKGVFVFTLGTSILEEDWPLEKFGVSEGSSIEVTVLDSSRPCFEWYCCDPSNGNAILDKGSTFQRCDKAAHTDGVQTRAALPRETACYICFHHVGTHACLGVGTNKCKLAETSYVHLYGQDENSWALCFGLDREFAAYHKGQLCVMQDLNGKALAPVKHERGEAREA